ncbi:MAG: uncharacterized protein KVP18_004776 [Porospora cf. gigantea A]|uniref:uncharacterized protein n=1 Tax=Porospora cf. gigantea A TaxID=2853593 RepID=UPI00355A1727|nr:MAG: hypothetical protein KVP18_004776 [Porospora cf. gigantea A]
MPLAYDLADLLSDVIRGALFQFTPKFYHQLWGLLVVGLSWFCFAGAVLVALVRPNKMKQWAYILSAIVASTTTVMALPVSVYLVQAFIQSDKTYEEVFLARSTYTDFIVSFYILYLHLDMLGAALIYWDHMDPFVGWLHHIVYILICNNALYWNWTVGLAAMFVEEMPTALLSLGQVFPQMRTDVGFGVTFISTRIIYHISSLVMCIYVLHDVTYVWLVGILTMLLHFWWFGESETGLAHSKMGSNGEDPAVALRSHSSPTFGCRVNHNSNFTFSPGLNAGSPA